MHGGNNCSFELGIRNFPQFPAALLGVSEAGAGLCCTQGKLKRKAGQNASRDRMETGVFYSSAFFFSSRKCHGPPKQALQPRSLHLHRHVGPAAPPAPLPPLQVQPGQIPCRIARAAGPAQPQRPHCLCCQPQARSLQCGGTSQAASPIIISAASQLLPGFFCCRARLMHQTQCVNTSPTLVPQSCSPEVYVDIPWCQRCSSVLSVAAGFALVNMNPGSELRRKKKSGLQLVSIIYSPPCFIKSCLYGETG